ncbi:lysophospholipid acyltransferase family protein [Alkaliphilus transvaalensis]|uniref:lysophospholipid acyltransferase family protein n=1 Tax=Alkaliphilus transvaalensis TaxID=114628 RepID=UPI00047EA4F7|nr:lysophospholipid acyltransferase family protein [Alkaliphilus transvaalensis]
MQNIFTEDQYYTPEDTNRFLLDRLSLGTRYYFHYRFVKIILRAKKIADAGKFTREEWVKASYDILKVIEGCGGKFHVTGLKNLDDCEKPLVIVSNHMSTLETMIFPCLIASKMKASFIIKASLATHPFIGSIMRARKPIVVNRVNPREDLQTVMTQGVQMLEEGRSIIMFPQSTRTTSFNPEEFNSLGVKLAKKANVQVLPVAIKTDFWENGKYLKDLGPIYREEPIHIAFGEPMDITGNGREEHKRIIDFISSHHNEWNHKK